MEEMSIDIILKLRLMSTLHATSLRNSVKRSGSEYAKYCIGFEQLCLPLVVSNYDIYFWSICLDQLVKQVMLDLCWNVLAFGGIFLMSLQLRDSSREIERLKQKEKDLRQSQFFSLQSENNPLKIQLEKIKKQNKAMKVALWVPARLTQGLTAQTFSRTYNDFKISTNQSLYFLPSKFGFMEGETGGQFWVNQQGQKLKVDIRQCNISRHLLLKEIPKQHQIFKGQQPKYESLTFSFKTGCNLVIAGLLSYSLQEKKWLLLPSFMMERISKAVGKEKNLEQAFDFLKEKISQEKFIKGFSLVIISLLVATRSQYIINFVKKLRPKIFRLFKKPVQTDFDSIQEVIARESDKLRCRCGRTLNMIYQCRHLSSCEVCYEAAQVKQCRICGADGAKAFKIFT